MDSKDEARVMECEEGACAQTNMDLDSMTTVEDYDFSPFQRTDKKTLLLLSSIMMKCKKLPPEETVQKVAKALGLTLKHNTLPTINRRPLIVISLVPTTPELTYAGHTYEEAANEMMQHLCITLNAALNRAYPP